MVLMPADAVNDVLRAEATGGGLRKLSSLLGLARPHPAHLVAAGLLKPVPRKTKGPTVRKTFSKAEVDRFLWELFSRATPAPTMPPGAVDVLQAASRSRRSLSEILEMILADRLRLVWRINGRVGVAAIAVGADEIHAIVRADDPDVMPFYAALKVLGVGREALSALLDQGVIESVKVKCPAKGGTATYVPTRAILDFDKAHVSLSSLAKQRRTFPSVLRAALDAAGVEPQWPPEILQARWYLRSEVEAKLPE
jgi:hypothetical protein